MVTPNPCYVVPSDDFEGRFSKIRKVLLFPGGYPLHRDWGTSNATIRQGGIYAMAGKAKSERQVAGKEEKENGRTDLLKSNARYCRLVGPAIAVMQSCNETERRSGQ